MCQLGHSREIFIPYKQTSQEISHQTRFQKFVLAFANVISYKFSTVVNESAIPMAIKLVTNENAEIVIDNLKAAIKNLKKNEIKIYNNHASSSAKLLSSSAAMIGKQRKDFFRQEVPYREATKAPAGQLERATLARNEAK